MKKTYLKPDAEYVTFYSAEEITEIAENLDQGMDSEMSSVNLGDYDISDWS